MGRFAGMPVNLDQATEVDESCSVTVTGRIPHTEHPWGSQSTPSSSTRRMRIMPSGWRRPAKAALVIGGDHLVISETRRDVDAAARLGTLVIGFVPMRP